VLEVEPLEQRTLHWVDQQEELEDWLATLEPPVGVMASTDLRAGMVLDACQRLSLRVPEDVAVIGVDNDPVACEFRAPRLSSVSRNDYEVGFRAAEFLHRLIQGEPMEKPVILVPPDGVVSRRSTEVLAVEDPLIAGIVQSIASRLHEPFGVDGLLSGRNLSRRRIEQRFIPIS
jgi:LacI family transcriptional regulator